MEEWKKNPISVEGEFDSETWRWIKFIVTKCENTTESKHCAPEEEIK
jgi:hypothetical protein